MWNTGEWMTAEDLLIALCWFIACFVMAFIAYTFGAYLLGR
jgi:hypothetical protein